MTKADLVESIYIKTGFSKNILATGIATFVLCVYTPAIAKMFKIENPAANIYNPASRMNEPNPISPPTQAIPQPTAQVKETPTENQKVQPQQSQHPQAKHAINRKNYKYKSARAYINAAKKAFVQDNYLEFLLITEDALRRINAKTLNASKKLEKQLIKYKAFGHGLIDKDY